MVLDWITTKPLEDVTLRNVFRLALQIATFEEIEFWESFIERCVKYRYNEEATSLLPYMLEIFQLFGAENEISQRVKLKKAGADAREVRFLQSVLSGCRRMVPQWEKKYVGLVVKKIIQVWKESYSEYPMLFEDLKWIIQFSQ